MAKIKGVCKNIDEECGSALSKTVQEIERSNPFVCEECGKPLIEVKGGGSSKPGGGSKLPLIVIVAGILLGGIGAGVYFGVVKKDKVADGPKIEQPAEQQLVANKETAPAAKAIEKIELKPAETTLPVGHSGELMVEVTPTDADKSALAWESSDPAVVTVANGNVTAVAQGTATITVKDTKTNLSASSAITVKTEGGNGGGTTAVTSGEPFPYGKYTGDKKNGKADGLGTLVYTKSQQISKNDPQKRVAEVGDKITGQFSNNEPTAVKWYGKDGSLKGSIIVGTTGIP